MAELSIPEVIEFDPRCAKCGMPMPKKEGCTYYCCMSCNTANKVTGEVTQNGPGIVYKNTEVKQVGG